MTSLAIVVNHTDKRDLPVAGQLTDVNALLPSTSIDWPDVANLSSRRL